MTPEPLVDMSNDLQSLIPAETSSREEVWITTIGRLEARCVAEIGVYRGAFAAQLLGRCPAIERYFMIDPWRPLERWNKPLNVSSAEFDECLSDAMATTEPHAAKRVVLRGTTLEVVDQIPDESLDFAYIDGDHTLRGIATDMLLIWPKIRDGGIIGGDDFMPTMWQHAARFEPTLVFPYAVYFAEAMNAPITALPDHQFAIEKRAPFSFTDPTGAYTNLELAGEIRPPRQPFDLRQAARSVLRRAHSRLRG
jgi:hypothetical protein